jgi:hypothetical protein
MKKIDIYVEVQKIKQIRVYKESHTKKRNHTPKFFLVLSI